MQRTSKQVNRRLPKKKEPWKNCQLISSPKEEEVHWPVKWRRRWDRWTKYHPRWPSCQFQAKIPNISTDNVWWQIQSNCSTSEILIWQILQLLLKGQSVLILQDLKNSVPMYWGMRERTKLSPACSSPRNRTIANILSSLFLLDDSNQLEIGMETIPPFKHNSQPVMSRLWK